MQEFPLLKNNKGPQKKMAMSVFRKVNEMDGCVIYLYYPIQLCDGHFDNEVVVEEEEELGGV